MWCNGTRKSLVDVIVSIVIAYAIILNMTPLLNIARALMLDKKDSDESELLFLNIEMYA